MGGALGAGMACMAGAGCEARGRDAGLACEGLGREAAGREGRDDAGWGCMAGRGREGLGREGLRFAIEDMTEIRLMVIRSA